MSKSTNILVVEDDQSTAQVLESLLAREGFRAITAANAVLARQAVAREAITMALIDIGLPGEDGLSLTRFLRERFDPGIIILSNRASPVDKVIGLEVGANDYVTKPFDGRELMARIKNLLRLIERAGTGVTDATKAIVGQCKANLNSRQLFDSSGKRIEMTGMEFDLLECFLRHPHRLLSREQLLQMAHARGDGASLRSIDIRVSRLRRKIEPEPGRPRYLKTIYGKGYIFEPEAAVC